MHIQKIYFNQEVNKQHCPSFAKFIIFLREKYLTKINAIENVFLCLHRL